MQLLITNKVKCELRPTDTDELNTVINKLNELGVSYLITSSVIKPREDATYMFNPIIDYYVEFTTEDIIVLKQLLNNFTR